MRSHFMEQKYLNQDKEYKYKIILYDDEQGVIDTLKVILMCDGNYVYGTTNFEDFINKLKTEDFDILIIDYFLDGIHGDEALEKSREHAYLYTILLTGNKEDLPEEETKKRMGLQSYCLKSDNFMEISNSVKEAVKLVAKYKEGDIDKLSMGERIALYRKGRGLTQDDLAKIIEMSRETISKIEKGLVNTGFQNILRLADYFKVDVNYLLNGTTNNRN